MNKLLVARIAVLLLGIVGVVLLVRALSSAFIPASTPSPQPVANPARISSAGSWDTYTGVRITHMVADDQYVWLATANAGLIQWDIDDNTYEKFFYKRDDVTATWIPRIALDRKGGVLAELANRLRGTSLGLARFDGSSWTTYLTQAAVSLPQTLYYPDHTIDMDLQGNIWYFKNQGIKKADGSVEWNRHPYNESGISSEFYVKSVAADGKGNVWFETTWTVLKFDGKKWTTFSSRDGVDIGAAGLLAVDREDNVWVLGREDLYRYNGKSWDCFTKQVSAPNLNTATGLAFDQANVAWLASSSGVSTFDGTKWVSYNTSNSDLPSNDIKGLAIDGRDSKWFATGSTLIKFDGNSWSTFDLNANGPAANSFGAVTVDKDDNKWFGAVDGLDRYDGKNWTHYQTGDTNAIAIDGHGSKWLATSKGIVKIDAVTWITYTEADSGLPNSYIGSIAIDKDDTKWFALDIQKDYPIARHLGAASFDGTKWITYTTKNSGIAGDDVYQIAVDDQNNKWFATTRGVSKFDGTTWTTYTPENSGLLSPHVTAVAIDGRGNKWFGTVQGVSKFDGSNWVSYTASDIGLGEYGRILTIAFDKAGNVWLGTTVGIREFDGKTWRSYTEANSGINESWVTSIAFDRQGDAWLTTDGGGINRLAGAVAAASPDSGDGQVAATATPMPPIALPTEPFMRVATPTPNAQATATPLPTLKATYVQLTDNSRDEDAIWVDNDTVRFFRYKDTQGFIGELHPSSGDLALSPLPRNLDVDTFHWSPKGKYLLMRQRGWWTKADPMLWLYEVSAHELTELPTPGIVISRTLGIAWTPDESSVLVLMTHVYEDSDVLNNEPQIVAKIDIASKQVSQIVDLRPVMGGRVYPGYSDISVSPENDVALISELLDPNMHNSSKLLRLDIKTGELSELPVAGSGTVEWSPNGKRVAFYARRTIEPYNRLYELWVASSNGSDARMLLRDSFPLGWLPDGQHLLLANLSLIDADTGEVTELAISNSPPPEDMWSVWSISPDGKRFLEDTKYGLGTIVMGE